MRTASIWQKIRDREEFPACEGSRYFEPGIALAFADGVRDLRLRFAGAEVDEDRDIIQVRLEDPQYPISVILSLSGAQ